MSKMMTAVTNINTHTEKLPKLHIKLHLIVCFFLSCTVKMVFVCLFVCDALCQDGAKLYRDHPAESVGGSPDQL